MKGAALPSKFVEEVYELKNTIYILQALEDNEELKVKVDELFASVDKDPGIPVNIIGAFFPGDEVKIVEEHFPELRYYLQKTDSNAKIPASETFIKENFLDVFPSEFMLPEEQHLQRLNAFRLLIDMGEVSADDLGWKYGFSENEIAYILSSLDN